MRQLHIAGFIIVTLLMWSCVDSEKNELTTSVTQVSPSQDSAMPGEDALLKNQSVIERNAYFGDLHIHTGYSADAYIFNVRATPDDAYRYGKGEAIRHPSGQMMQAPRPFDFIAVTDHAEYLGVLPLMDDPTSPLARLPLARELISGDLDTALGAFGRIADSIRRGKAIPELSEDTVIHSAWSEIVDAAERHYRPGEFTTLIGFEWSSAPNDRNLHRNVIFRGGRDQVPNRPFSALDSSKPEELWNYMEEARQQGFDVLAIPHNSNLSNGLMFAEYDSWGKPLDAAWAERRNRNEPLVEISQVKGTSETHPDLSPDDPWADFAILERTLAGPVAEDELLTKGGYARDAYKTGIGYQDSRGFNPFVFGVIGSSDSHNANVAVEEDDFSGKLGIMDGSVEQRREGGFTSIWSASGLAGVWAEENTRDSIFTALERKEAFGTSGTRIALRFFAAWNLPEDILERPGAAALLYEKGVPMGGNLPAGPPGQAPEFIVWALQDPHAAPLQRLQIVKGWIEGSTTREQIYDVACAKGAPDAEDYRCPPDVALIDLETCEIANEAGVSALSAHWQDPTFDPSQQAFYYVRTLEVPSCHWSTWDAVKNDLPLMDEAPKTIQERAWSSPVWYQPRSNGLQRATVAPKNR